MKGCPRSAMDTKSELAWALSDGMIKHKMLFLSHRQLNVGAQAQHYRP